MKLLNLRVNQLHNPMGYDFSYLTLSWQAESEISCFSEEIRIKIWTEAEDCPCFDSGVQKSFRKNLYYVQMSLKPRTRYFWKVWVKGEAGDQAESEIAWFETGKGKEAWRGQWIGTEEDAGRMPILYKEFVVQKELRAARLYIYGAGLYEVYLNHKKADNEYLQPGYHSYDLRMEYQTLDVMEHLVQGTNVLSVLLGEGWYKGRFGFDGNFKNLYGDRKKCIGELYLSFTDGSEECIATDVSWKAVQSNVLQNNIYDGEWVDDTLEAKELTVEALQDTRALLTERTNPPIHKTECFVPVTEKWEDDGTLLLDFGEMITGWVEWHGRLQRNQKVCLKYGEVLQNQRFYRENLRTAQAEFVYVSDGIKEEVRPHFTYFGFRYVQVSGLKKTDMLSFRAYRLMSDILQTGWVHTSNEKVNTLIENTRRSQKCNFLDIPTDCPQRDERMGWTGDVAVFAATACFHEDCAAFFRHYTKSLYEEQKLLGGAVPFFAPRIKIREREGLNPFYNTAGACGWADVATILPWTLYQYYGDRQMLAEQYPMMCAWVDYVTEQSGSNKVPYLWQNGMHLGDWLALDNGDIHNPIGKTDIQLLASAYYYYSTLLCSRAASVVQDIRAEEFQKLSERIKAAFLEYYYGTNVVGECCLLFEPTQTACAILLQFGLYPEDGRKLLAETLEQLLEENNGLLNTGFLGTPVLCPALSENGLNHKAYLLLKNERYPGWLYEVNIGATTIWERWNSQLEDGSISDTGMNSLNHYAYGSIAEWIYRYMCGFRPQMSEDICMLISPMPDVALKKVEGSWQSIYGQFISGWSYEGKKGFIYHFCVPFNVKAKICLPKGQCFVLRSGEYYFDENGIKVESY